MAQDFSSTDSAAPDAYPTVEPGTPYQQPAPELEPPYRPKYWLHLLLFVVTLITTTLAGLEWTSGAKDLLAGDKLNWDVLASGLYFAVPFLGILTCHEFGHYFTARYYKASVSLPYYIPLWLGWAGMFSIGTMGAFIRILTPMRTRQQLFDVGAAGPLAGFVAIIVVLVYGYTHLPPPEYIFTIHPEYAKYGLQYASYAYQQGADFMAIRIGPNLATSLLESLADPARLPNSYEMMHYPILFAGYVALFFTALNLLPIGQLDGGHILYGMVGPRWHSILSPLFFITLVVYSGIGVPQVITTDLTESQGLDALQWNLFYLAFLYFTFSRTVEGFLNVLMLALSIFAIHYSLAAYAPGIEGYNGWLIFCLVLGRALGIYHPPSLIEEPLSRSRKIIGYISLLVFILSFSPRPFLFE